MNNNHSCQAQLLPNKLLFFHSRKDFGYPTKNIVNTTGCTLSTCVPIGLQTINATGRGNFIMPTNDDSPFCGKFFEISR